MRSTLPLQITFALAVQTAEVAAQYPETAQPFGTIAGTVREAATGAAPLRTSVCAFLRLRTRLWNRCGQVDTLGAYQIDSVPRVALIYVACEHLREYQPGSLASDTLEIPDSRQLRKDWEVVLTKCDQRPLRRVRGVFEGRYNAAFESVSFVPCPRDAWFVPGDSLDVVPATGKFASPDWSPAFGQRVRWPSVQPDSFGMHRYFARWRGTIEGPGRYGHMGLAPFVFHVDSMLEFRAASSRDCR